VSLRKAIIAEGDDTWQIEHAKCRELTPNLSQREGAAGPHELHGDVVPRAYIQGTMDLADRSLS
jgi:hypothetical protein